MLRCLCLFLLLAGAARAESTENLLALSWQPAFCDLAQNGRKPECAKLNGGELPWTEEGFTLHGLWPQPRSAEYCGISTTEEASDRAGDWDALPKIALDRETAAALIRLMPGVRSQLERHEWTRHGSCYGDEAGQLGYFRDALWLTAEVNAALGPLMSERLGGQVALAELRDALDAQFGAGTGNALEMDCRRDGDRWLVSEIRLHLTGEIDPSRPLSPLLARPSPVPSDCDTAEVDAAGAR
ncbi:ribonuclease T [Poseidonocella sp. HB161398]|uniref:ribonuclease T2 family protein n=1 Tax=Poseidonocella sp. HB161398 TaxID=2320855 RepID=UPI0011096F78|nr:ribonuclease T [Poseidonocella sp. HB161398]